MLSSRVKAAAARLLEGDVRFLVLALPDSTHSLNAATNCHALREMPPSNSKQHGGGCGCGSINTNHIIGSAAARRQHRAVTSEGRAAGTVVEEYWKSVCKKCQLWLAVNLPKGADTHSWMCSFGCDEPLKKGLNHHRNLVQSLQ